MPHEVEGDDWLGFRAVRALDDDVLLVPLTGHTRGHSGVAVRRDDRWLLDAGDAYFDEGEIDTPPRLLPGLVGFERIVAHDERARRDNQAQLRALRREHPEVSVFSAHDRAEWRALAGSAGGCGQTAVTAPP